MLSFFRSFSINFSINLFVNIIIKLAWESKMSKFVQIAKDIINIRRITEPNKAEDGDEPVHGFIENTLYPVFGGKISSSEQFQKHHWKQIQKYLRHSYDSNQHCDVSVVVSDGKVTVNRLMVILLFPEVLHICDNDLELVILPDYTLDQITENIHSFLTFSNNNSNSDCNNNSVDEEEIILPKLLAIASQKWKLKRHPTVRFTQQ